MFDGSHLIPCLYVYVELWIIWFSCVVQSDFLLWIRLSSFCIISYTVLRVEVTIYDIVFIFM